MQHVLERSRAKVSKCSKMLQRILSKVLQAVVIPSEGLQQTREECNGVDIWRSVTILLM